MSAQTTVDISRHDLDKVMGETEAASAKHAEHDAHAVPAGSVHPEQAPPFKTLDRQGTKYFDAGKKKHGISGPHSYFLLYWSHTCECHQLEVLLTITAQMWHTTAL